MSSQYVPVSLKRLVFKRANGMCEYCRSPAKYAIDSLVMEHIQPISQGGQTLAENLALSCQTCNNCKYTKTTPTGRATIGQLQTNRDSVVNIRRVLTVMNEHPPD